MAGSVPSTHGDFDTFYSDEPWSIMDKNQREWYDPELINQWRQKSIFKDILTFTKNLGSVRATSMSVTELLDPHPDFTALASRQIWMPAMHLDSRQVDIVFQHNGSKVAYHKYDDMVTYWKQNNVAGLRSMMRGALGQSEVDINDLLARNALIKGSFTTGYNMIMGGGDDFSDIAVGDKMDTTICSDIWLGMANRGVNQALGPKGAEGSIVCYTSPGVIYDLQKDSAWVTIREYLQDQSLLNYEVGAYKNVRFVQSPKCTLWNAGEVICRAPIKASHTAGDGCNILSKVDGTYATGQNSDGITHYLQLGDATSGSLTDIKVNDIITIHKTTTAAYGITDGVDFNEGTAMYRRVMSIDPATKRITLDLPIMIDYNVDLGAGVYGYVTLGRNVHASIFVGGPQAIVGGVAQPPRFYSIDPIDDYKAIYRFTWDQYLGYQAYRPELFEVVFSAGTTRVKGAAKVQ
jgi:hypothetical protein